MNRDSGFVVVVAVAMATTFFLVRGWQESMLLLLPPNADFDGVLSASSKLMYEQPVAWLQLGIGLPFLLLGAGLIYAKRRAAARVAAAIALLWAATASFLAYSGYTIVANQAM